MSWDVVLLFYSIDKINYGKGGEGYVLQGVPEKRGIKEIQLWSLIKYL